MRKLKSLNHRLKLGFSVAALLLISLRSAAQDIQLTQFFEMPLYLNPAFAGSSHHYRGIMHQRLQWPSLNAHYVSSLFSVDGYFNDAKSGVGLMVTQDWQGPGTLNTTTVSGQYAYELHISENLTVRPGLQLSYLSPKLDFGGLTFPDQYNDNGFQGGGKYANLGGDRVHRVDVTSGAVFYTSRAFGGYSVHHMNRPNISFVPNIGTGRWPVKHEFIFGYKIPVVHKKYMAYLESEKDISITPTAHYKFQGKSDQLDLGIYANYDQLMFAVWYRGIPFKKYEKALQNNESVALLLGWRYGSFAVTYSYDFVVSRLTRAGTGGAHELNITFIRHKVHKNAKPMKVMPCPNFYKRHSDKHHVDTHHHDVHPHASGGVHEDKDTHHHVEHHQADQHHVPGKAKPKGKSHKGKKSTHHHTGHH